MSRHPVARQKVLDASRAIVAARGAGSLTYDEIAQVSGVTRGGITYHFPTKADLLRGLIEDDLEQWQRLESELRPEACCETVASLVATIRSYTADDPARRRFVAGMLSAVTHDPDILDSVRAYENSKSAAGESLDALILRLAAAGLFWAETFACPEIAPKTRRTLVRELERRALDLNNTNKDTNPK